MLASRPTRRGASMPESLSFWTWFRTSSLKGLAIDPASIFLAPGAFIFSMLLSVLDTMADAGSHAMAGALSV